MGDVKLAAVMGLFLGRNVAPAIFVALLAGSVVGLAMIALHGAQARKRAIPFGPFLALGGVVGLLAGRPADRLVSGHVLLDASGPFSNNWVIARRKVCGLSVD